MNNDADIKLFTSWKKKLCTIKLKKKKNVPLLKSNLDAWEHFGSKKKIKKCSKPQIINFKDKFVNKKKTFGAAMER